MNDNPYDEETLEECKARLQRISEEVKAELKAGTLLKPKTDRLTRDGLSYDEMYSDFDMADRTPIRHDPYSRSIIHEILSKYPIKTQHSVRYTGDRPDLVIIDECHHIKPDELWIPKDHPYRKMDSVESTPNQANRVARRAKKKAKRK